MKLEIEALENNGTWTVETLPPKKRLLVANGCIGLNIIQMELSSVIRQDLLLWGTTKLRGWIIMKPLHQW